MYPAGPGSHRLSRLRGGLRVGGGCRGRYGRRQRRLQGRVILVHEQAGRWKPEKLRSLNARPVVRRQV